MDCTFSKPIEEPMSQNGRAAPADAIVYPLESQTVPPGLFDSVCGLVHYFVRPDDEFALNSLELVDADAYLYRLLRREGYERVAFVEVESTNCQIYAYDPPSGAIFQAASEKKGLDDLTLRRTAPKAACPTPAVIGRRMVQSFSQAEQFQKKFVAEINHALEDARTKTAIVMPLSIFEKAGFFSDAIISTVNRLERISNRKNILVLTMPRRDDLRWCFEGNRAQLHAWVNAIVTNPDRLNMVKEALRILKSLGIIVLADEYQADEIANLLLRKKHLEQSPLLAAVPDTALYHLAGQLRDHCTQVQDQGFQHIPYLDRRGNCIRQLNALLDRPQVQEELAERARRLPVGTTRLAYSRELEPLMLERVCRLGLRRYESSGTLDEIMAELDRQVGPEMERVKQEILNTVQAICRKREDPGYLNMVFSGPPGTGKTTIARLTARLLHAKHILSSDKTVEVSARTLVSSHIGETGENIRAAFEEAEGGVLFIDEFHGFDNAHQHGNLAQEAVGALVAGINAHRTSTCVILAGYEEGVRQVLRADPGASRRFRQYIHFQPYSTNTLLLILESNLNRQGSGLEPEAGRLLRRVIESDKAVLREQLGNGGYVENLLSRLEESRLEQDPCVYTREDVLRAFPEKSWALSGGEEAEDILNEFDRLAGAQMQQIKATVKETADSFLGEMERIQRLRELGKQVSSDDLPFMNMKFLGPPGTGKTTVAKLVARYFTARGILHHSQTTQLQAVSLVRGTVGGTGNALREAAQNANGGVLIIDEFQALANSFTGGNTGLEAMRALVAAANEYQGSLCLIATGYEEEVEHIFQMDSGANRRFPTVVHFEHYDLPTLMAIFDSLIGEETQGIALHLEPDARALLERAVQRAMDRAGRSFGNAGAMKDTFLAELQKKRRARDPEDTSFRREDVLAAFPGLLSEEKERVSE